MLICIGHVLIFFFNDTATTEIYTLSLHDALPICPYYIDADKIRRDVTEDREGIPLPLRLKVIDSETCRPTRNAAVDVWHCDADRKSTRLNSSHANISYAVFCLKKKTTNNQTYTRN